MLTPPLFKLLVVMLCTVLLVSCGSGDTATAPTEVINGITVPLEPDPVANKATLAGIDSNKNGVRDDVERKIAEQFENKSFIAMTYAKLYTARSTNDFNSIKLLNKTIACSPNKLTTEEMAKIESLTLNNEVRIDAMLPKYFEDIEIGCK